VVQAERLAQVAHLEFLVTVDGLASLDIPPLVEPAGRRDRAEPLDIPPSAVSLELLVGHLSLEHQAQVDILALAGSAGILAGVAYLGSLVRVGSAERLAMAS